MQATTDTVSTLNDLIKTSKDGEYGFQSCAGNAERPDLKALFESRARECREAAAELHALVVGEGGEPEDRGSIAGAVHRGWVAARTAMTRRDDLAVLEECERGEDTAMDNYRKALEEDLPPTVRTVVQRQYEGVKRNHATVRSLRDAMKNASA